MPYTAFLDVQGEMGSLIREYDWSTTPLGPAESWPQSLLTTLSIILTSRFPMIIIWGPEHIVLYNDAYAEALKPQGKHPKALGCTAKEVWPTRWEHEINPSLRRAGSGESVYTEDQLIVTNRHGQPQNVYWTVNYGAIKGESGDTAGILVTCTDTTQRVENLRQARDSDRNFRKNVKQAPIGIVIFKGPQFIVEMANDTYLSIIDKSEEAFVNKPFFDVLPELRKQVESLLTNVLTTGIPYEGQEFPVTLLRRGRAELTFFNFIYQPLRESDGHISGIMVVAMEVTEMALARHALIDSERKFRHMVMQAPTAMAIFKSDEFIVDLANPVMLTKLWRRKEKDVVGKRLLDIFPELKDQKFPELLKQVYSKQIIYRETEALAHVEGDDGMKSFYLDFVYAPLIDGEGKTWGILASVYDTTEKVKGMQMLEQKVRERTKDLEHTNRLLERSNEDLQQFAHVASHDLKEPVRKITIYGQRLEEEFGATLGARGSQYLTRILHSTRRMYDMIDGILGYSSLQGLEQPTTSIDLNKVIHDIRTDLELLIHEKRAILHAKDLPVIKGMPDLVYQLWYNLINNALKFSKPGVPPEITLTATQNGAAENNGAGSGRAEATAGGGFIELSLRDNGIGFPNDKAVLIFETFRRLNSKDAFEGTGLGLALCKKIVERHRGTITATGQPGVGAEFIIRWPAGE